MCAVSRAILFTVSDPKESEKLAANLKALNPAFPFVGAATGLISAGFGVNDPDKLMGNMLRGTAAASFISDIIITGGTFPKHLGTMQQGVEAFMYAKEINFNMLKWTNEFWELNAEAADTYEYTERDSYWDYREFHLLERDEFGNYSVPGENGKEGEEDGKFETKKSKSLSVEGEVSPPVGDGDLKCDM